MRKSILLSIVSVFSIILSISCQSLDMNTFKIDNSFDFWVGKWEVSWLGPDSTLVKGTNYVERFLDGRVIQENFHDPSRQFKGTSISVYNPKTKTWHQAWADNLGGHFNFVGTLTDQERIFEMEKNDERGARYRMVFSEINANSFIWKWQGIRDGWDEWKTL